jgi:hypothetical protein
MPITQPAGTELFLSKQGGSVVPVVLLDIETLDGTLFFWSDFQGVYLTKLPACTRLQISGGTSTTKYFFSGGTTVAGDSMHAEVNIYNNGSVPVVVWENSTFPSSKITIPPGSILHYVSDLPSGGANAQIAINTQVVGDAIDVLVSDPVLRKNGVSLNPNPDFATGWVTFSGSSVTVTQAVAGPKFYSGWIKSGCNFTCTKDMSSNAGDLLLQNISGNTIDRDVAAALKNHEFEGAYAVTRLWIPLLDVAIREFHCSLTEQNPKEDEAGFRELQLFDPTQYVLAGDVQAETCTFRFKSAQCGSTGTATSCPKRLVDCQDATRLAQERYPGILTTMPNTVNVPPLAGIGPRPPRPVPGGGRRPLPL